MKRKILIVLVSLACITACAFGLSACNLFGGDSQQGQGQGQGQQGVSYGTATVNFHYEYDVVIENYREYKYSIASGTTLNIELTYTPPMKAGYRFLGWTREAGGAGEVVGTTYDIKGSGFGGTVYNFYAKYEVIEFDVVYHLDGGINHPDNPTHLTGKQTLKEPTKEKYRFDGWYREPEFDHYTSTASMIDDKTTTVDLYAKWTRVYTITCVSDQEGVTVVGDKSVNPRRSFTASDMEFTVNLQPEYYDGYLFLGWEVEEGADLVYETIHYVNINPKDVTDDLVFTAHYMEASHSSIATGLMVYYYNSQPGYYAREGVEQIIVGDIKNKNMISRATVYYSGEQPPEVICREGVVVEYIYDPTEVESKF